MCYTEPNSKDDKPIILGMLVHSPRTAKELMELANHRADLPDRVGDAAERAVRAFERAERAGLQAYRQASLEMSPEEFNRDHQEPLD